MKIVYRGRLLMKVFCFVKWWVLMKRFPLHHENGDEVVSAKMRTHTSGFTSSNSRKIFLEKVNLSDDEQTHFFTWE